MDSNAIGKNEWGAADPLEASEEFDSVPSGQLAGEPSDQHGCVKFHGEVDLPTAEDRLGFEPYAAAVADFLTAADTHAPLALSIEGLWVSSQ